VRPRSRDGERFGGLGIAPMSDEKHHTLAPAKICELGQVQPGHRNETMKFFAFLNLDVAIRERL
jgi:hypothetical protein